MKETYLTLLKFRCDNRDCGLEIYVNPNDNAALHYHPGMGQVMDWPCFECEKGYFRYAPTNQRYEYRLVKRERAEPMRGQSKEQAG